jgi:hypothetical protein
MALGRNRRILPVLFVVVCALVQPSVSAAYVPLTTAPEQFGAVAGVGATSPSRMQVIEGEPGGSVDPQPLDESGAVRLMAVGDVSLGWEVGRKITRRGPQAPWVGAAQFFDQADLVVANLECVISRRGDPWPSKLIHLRAPLAAADSLVAGGIDMVSVANNHALDFGLEGFYDTLRLLDERQIEHPGGGANYSIAHAPQIVEQNGLRIAFLAYVLPFSSRTTFSTREWAAGPNTPGLAIATRDEISRDVSAARLDADLVVVMLHSGTEYLSRPNRAQRNLAQAAIEAGATLVLEHGPHVLQGYRSVDGTLVAYSLGNFVFARFDGAANDTAILDVTLTRDGVSSFGWIPMIIKGGIPRPATGADADRILGRLEEL